MYHILRLFAALMTDFKSSDYLVTSDADLFPLFPDHFLTERDWTRTCHLYNAFGAGQFLSVDGRVKDMFPIGYIGMTAQTWRVISAHYGIVPSV